MKPLSYAAVVLLCLVAVALTGCGKPAPPEATTAQQPLVEGQTGSAEPKAKALKIAMIAKSSTNPVFLSARTGAEAAAKELSAKHGCEITIDWRTPPTEDGTVQAQRIAQAVNEGANCVLISCSDAAKVTGAIDDAVSRGVPVMTFDSDAPGSKRFAFYGVDDIKTGAMVMDELAPLIGQKGKVAILAGNQNAPNLQKRVQGAKEAAKKYPGIEIVGTFYHVETPQDAAAEVTRVMNAYPGIRGWAMIGGWPLFVKGAVDWDPAKVKVVSVDALPDQIDYVESGAVVMLLAQDCYGWGTNSVRLLLDKIVKKQDPPTTRVIAPLTPVTKENAAEFRGMWRQWEER